MESWSDPTFHSKLFSVDRQSFWTERRAQKTTEGRRGFIFVGVILAEGLGRNKGLWKKGVGGMGMG